MIAFYYVLNMRIPNTQPSSTASIIALDQMKGAYRECALSEIDPDER